MRLSSSLRRNSRSSGCSRYEGGNCGSASKTVRLALVSSGTVSWATVTGSVVTQVTKRGPRSWYGFRRFTWQHVWPHVCLGSRWHNRLDQAAVRWRRASGTRPAAGYPVSVTRQGLCRLVETFVGTPDDHTNVSLSILRRKLVGNVKSMAESLPRAKYILDAILLGAAKVDFL